MFREPDGGGENINIKKTAREETEAFFAGLHKLKDKSVCRGKISEYITGIIDNFSSGAKQKEDFEILMDKVSLFREIGSLDDIYEIERSWTQEQIDFLIQNYNSFFIEDDNLSNNNFGFFRALSTSRKEDLNEETVSEKTTRAIIRLIDKNEIIPLSLQESLALMGQNIQMIRAQERFDLISIILENPGKIYEEYSRNFQSGIGLMYKESDLMIVYENRKSNLAEILKIIDVLEFLIKNNVGFEESLNGFWDIVEKIEQDNQNFFLRFRIDLLKNNQRYDRDLLDKYSDISDKKVEPMDFRPIQSRFAKERELPYYAYNKISKKYGVIYNNRGGIDSFFELLKNNEAEELEQKRISIDEILKKEGFSKNSIEPQEYEKIVITYKVLIKPSMRNKIENEFGIKIKEFSIREQIQFVNFLSSKKIEEIERIKQFSDSLEGKDQKNNFIKSFLSLELDRNNGDKIIEIAQKLEKMEAQKVFEKIAELGDLAQKKDEELANIIFKDDSKEISSSVRSELMRRAHNIISRFSNELKSGEKADEEKIQKLLADLEQSRIEIDLVASLLIVGKKEGEAQKLEDIKGLEISEISGREVLENPELMGKLREMYRANNSHKSKEDLERLMSDFEKHLEYDAKFYLVYFNKDGKSGDKKLENLVGFMRSSNFDGMRKLENNERYLGAMNIDPLLQKFYFGENFLRETIKKEFQLGAQKIVAHMPKDGPSHNIIKTLDVKCEEMPAGNYKLEDGREIERLLVELTKNDK